ncbi:MAG: helix-turn-helix domain-containing protein, partial [Phycisphaeraceae bacterium]
MASSAVSREADSHTLEPAEQCQRLASPLCAAVVHVTEVLSSTARSPVAAARLYRAPADLRGIANHTRLSPPVLWNDARSVLPAQWQAVLRTWSRWPELPGGLFAELAYRNIAYGVHASNGDNAVVCDAFARETQRARDGGAPLPAAMIVAVLPVAEECWAAVGMLRGMGERSEVNATVKLKMLLPAAAAALQRGYETEMYRAGHGSLFGTTSHAELRTRLDDLSRTEEAVLAELLDGKPTEKEVAQRLHRSHHTIHVHVKNIYRKLG